MTDLDSRKRKLDIFKNYRRKSCRKDIPTSFVLVAALAVLASFFLGFSTSMNQSNTVLNAEESTGSETFHVDGYNITFLPENHSYMEGNVIGKDFEYHNKRFFIQKNLSKQLTYETCVHERLHDMGMPGGNSTAHEWIDLHESRIEDFVCRTLMDRISKQGYFR